MSFVATADYFRMNNNIFDVETDENGKTKPRLSAIQMQVLAALYSIAPFKASQGTIDSVFDTYRVKVRQSVLAQNCNCSVSTIKRAITGLIEKGYIEAKARCEYIKDNQRFLGTYTYFLPKIARKGYFYVNRKALALLSKTQTRVYLFICKCIDSTKNFKSCWNSFNDIARQLKLHRNSVVQTIKELVELKVISKQHNKDEYIKDLYYDNFYSVSATDEINSCEDLPVCITAESVSTSKTEEEKAEEYLRVQDVFDEFVETEPIKEEEPPLTSNDSPYENISQVDYIMILYRCQEVRQKIRLNKVSIFFKLYALPP